MKRIVVVILIGLLVAPPAWADQKPGKPISWEKVTRLKAGTELIVTATDSPPTKVTLLFADDSLLVTRKSDAPKLPGRVKRALLDVGDRWPGILDGAGSVARDKVRVSPEGIFDGDQKLAELATVVQQTPRGDVRGISETRHSHIGLYILIGAAVGMFILGGFLAEYCRNEGC
jgi:hypothetical protein